VRAVVQRVASASVTVNGCVVGEIGKGMLVLLAATTGDSEKEIRWMAEKLCGLRIFPDESGKMNLSLEQIGGSMLIVSQFTLYGDCRKGKRPSWSQAAPPETAADVYRDFIREVKGRGIPVREGEFGAMMMVELINDGPVTLIVDTP
jgi:D-aminoacyl-tRNA deacylase